MIEIKEYKDDKDIVIKFLEELQDHVIQIDPLKRFVRFPKYGEKYANELIEKVSKQNGKIFLAMKKNIPLGMVIGYIDELTERDLLECVSSKIGTIEQLYVSPLSRGQNIGSMLIKEIEEYFKSQSCDVVYVGTLEPNKGARAFYKKSGYKDRVIEMMKKIS